MSNYGERNGIGGFKLAMIILAVVVGSIVLIVATVGGSFVSTYNNLVEMEEDVNLAKANVENMMQRRLELIPDLVETVKAYSKHEEKVFEDIANARAALASSLESGDTVEISEANNELSKQINNLLAVAEDYPTLTSGEQYTSLMDQLEGSVNRIAKAREEYNEEVQEYNTMVRKFPGSILAGMYGFERIEEFKADEAAKTTNMVDWSDD